jgi:hypothetical protein
VKDDRDNSREAVVCSSNIVRSAEISHTAEKENWPIKMMKNFNDRKM